MNYQQTPFHSTASCREMTITGTGEIMAQPDNVQIQIEVRTEGNEVTAAQQENALIMNRVIESLIALNIQREAMQTTIYSISPVYDYVEGRQLLRGYEVLNAISVTISDVRQAGSVIDTALQNGATGISSLQFSVDNIDDHYKKALHLALINAYDKAKVLANAMAVSLVLPPLEIIEEAPIVTPSPFMAMRVSQEAMNTPIEQGSVPITAVIKVRFQY